MFSLMRYTYEAYYYCVYDINNAQLKLMIVKCEEAQSPTFEGESEKSGLWTGSQRIYAQPISPAITLLSGVLHHVYIKNIPCQPVILVLLV